MLSLEEKATNADTYKHIHRVRELINNCVTDLLNRGHKHDQCKLAREAADRRGLLV